MSDVEIYAVGLLADLRDVVQAPGGKRRRAGRMLGYRFRRSWRRRSYWNGYLAEPLDHARRWERCGHGWTRGRAWDDLQAHLAEVGRREP